MLRGHRRAARLTLERLAEMSGVSARTLSDMERGRSRGPQHRTVTALADALSLEGDDREQLVELARDGRLGDHWTRRSRLCELPRPIEDFTGRAAELVRTTELAYTESSPGVGAVGLVTGSAGLGKTTFAVRAAHLLRPSFPDGVFFLDLFGMSQRPLAATEALRLLLRALGVADQDVPAGALERASLYRSLLRDKRVLVVLDNAGSEEQVRPLLPGGGAARALITTRRLLAGLEGVRRLALRPLPVPESTAMLTGILGERSASGEESALARLVELCGGLPLALRIIGSRLVGRPEGKAADLAARLADEERRLEQFTAGDLTVASAFGVSYEQLADPARRVFRRLAEVPGRDVGAGLAAVAGGMPIEDAWEALDDLVDLGLLQDSTTGRYRFHDLVRLFARARLQEEETPDEREALTRRVTWWLLRTATTAGRWFEPGFGRPDRPDPALADLPSAEAAERWLRLNVDNWLGALRTAARGGRHALVLDTAQSMHWFADRWVHSPHWHEVFGLGAEAAAALGDPVQQADQLNRLAWLHWVPPGDPEKALRYASEALELAGRHGATAQVAWSQLGSGRALLLLGRLDEALVSASRSAAAFKAVGDVDAYAQSLSLIGHCLRDEGRHAESLEQFLAWLALADEMTPSVAVLGRPYALIRVGQCLGALGRRTEAIATLTGAIDILRSWPNFRLAKALETLALLLAEDGTTHESRRNYARAAQLFTTIGDEEASRRCHALAADPRPAPGVGAARPADRR
ncbi:helix-turn-helix domain-containing protein [Streptomyces sp. SID4948]|nr:helix-turn-helix domain-containing protein [Streptomyces sp. SID4948]